MHVPLEPNFLLVWISRYRILGKTRYYQVQIFAHRKFNFFMESPSPSSVNNGNTLYYIFGFTWLCFLPILLYKLNWFYAHLTGTSAKRVAHMSKSIIISFGDWLLMRANLIITIIWKTASY